MRNETRGKNKYARQTKPTLDTETFDLIDSSALLEYIDRRLVGQKTKPGQIEDDELAIDIPSQTSRRFGHARGRNLLLADVSSNQLCRRKMLEKHGYPNQACELPSDTASGNKFCKWRVVGERKKRVGANLNVDWIARLSVAVIAMRADGGVYTLLQIRPGDAIDALAPPPLAHVDVLVDRRRDIAFPGTDKSCASKLVGRLNGVAIFVGARAHCGQERSLCLGRRHVRHLGGVLLVESGRV